jgi:carbamate kinase
MRKLAVYALGGNALQPPKTDSSTSVEVLARVMSDVIDLLEMDWSVIITHGNGPQVGHLMELDHESIHSLESWVAATQGMIGHDISMNLQGILQRRLRPERTAVILTRVVVDGNDPAFATPTKPVGPILDSKTVMSADWDIAQTIHGPRRVVASPKPIQILELDVIRKLVELQAVVICGGGGGVPVIDRDGHHVGVPAVIDKDLLSSRLAIDLKADALIISTDADAVYSGFGTPDAKAIRQLSLAEAEAMDDAGAFPAGSMAPKVKALCSYVDSMNEGQAIFCTPGAVLDALRGEGGTTFTGS